MRKEDIIIMKVFALAAALTLAATSTFAQTPPSGQPAPTPQQPAPKPQQPAPTPPQPAPQQPAPATPAPPPPAAQPPAPWPEGARFAYVNLQQIASQSAEGKAATARIQELSTKKQTEPTEKNKALQAAQQKLAQSGTVLNDTARAQLEKDIDRMQREIQFAQQNAQAEVQDLTQDLQQDFQNRVIPVIRQLLNEKGLHMIFSAGDSGIIAGNPGLDLSAEVIKRLDSAKTPAPPKK
jgi:Skp family chaperone for outer membrane proteins